MNRRIALLAASVAALVFAASCQSTPNYDSTLAPGAPALLRVPDPAAYPDFSADAGDRESLLASVDRSIFWTRREHARQFFPIAGIEHDRALASLERFRELLLETSTADELEAAIRREFDVYVSAGWNGKGGGVLFTGYCTPILPGAMEPGGPYRYPLYALPDDLVKGPQGEILGWETSVGLLAYPSRRAIEAGAMLEGKGLELAWLRDPLDAYIAHVNGSAFIELPDGGMYKLGYAGKNGRTYSSLGRALIEDGAVSTDAMSIQAIRDWAAQADPDIVTEYLQRNDSYVFFQPIDGNPHGSLDVEVEARRSVATDKTLFPRGAVCFVDCELPRPGGGRSEPVAFFALDQDTGGAIRTAGRADLYMGIGDEAEAVAGRVHSAGQLYYLFLK